MPSKAMILASDSHNPPAPIKPRNERKYTITPLGHKWLEWDKKQRDKELPMDALPHVIVSLQEQPGEFIDQAEQRRGIDTAWMDEI